MIDRNFYRDLLGMRCWAVARGQSVNGPSLPLAVTSGNDFRNVNVPRRSGHAGAACGGGGCERAARDLLLPIRDQETSDVSKLRR